jgi:hypothetical protein
MVGVVGSNPIAPTKQKAPHCGALYFQGGRTCLAGRYSLDSGYAEVLKFIDQCFRAFFPVFHDQYIYQGFSSRARADLGRAISSLSSSSEEVLRFCVGNIVFMFQGISVACLI